MLRGRHRFVLLAFLLVLALYLVSRSLALRWSASQQSLDFVMVNITISLVKPTTLAPSSAPILATNAPVLFPIDAAFADPSLASDLLLGYQLTIAPTLRSLNLSELDSLDSDQDGNYNWNNATEFDATRHLVNASMANASVNAEIEHCARHLQELGQHPLRPYHEPNWAQYYAMDETRSLIATHALGLTDHMKLFILIYNARFWGVGSGDGSVLRNAAATTCTLAPLIKLLGVTLFLDLPCGDQQWAQYLRKLNPGLKYIGVDIVPALIQHARKQFTNANTEFFLGSLTEDEHLLARVRNQSRIWRDEDVVLLHSRHVFFHLAFRDMAGFFAQVRQESARIRFFAFSNHNLRPHPQSDIVAVGHYRQTDIYAPPFAASMPRPLYSWIDMKHEQLPIVVIPTRAIPAAVMDSDTLAKMGKPKLHCDDGRFRQYCNSSENKWVCNVCF